MSRERLSLALKAGRSGTFDWDIPNNINTWSSGTEELYGLAPGTFGGTYEEWESLIVRKDLERVRTAIQEALKTGEFASEWRIRRRDNGEIRWVIARAKVFLDDAGQPSRMVGIKVDITERKHDEEKLRKASLYTRSLIEASLDPLVMINRDGKITDVNAATIRLTGVSRDRLIGSDFSDYFTEPEKARHSYQRVFAQGSVHDYPLAIRNTSGTVTDVLYNASVFRNEAGKVEGVFAAARDVTERKQAEKELALRAQELARSNSDLQQFAYVASHDLQEPLRMVASYTQLLGKRYRGKLDADADDFIAFAVDGAHRMQVLINDLLAYSRVGTRGKEFASTDCEGVLEAVLVNLKASDRGDARGHKPRSFAHDPGRPDAVEPGLPEPDRKCPEISRSGTAPRSRVCPPGSRPVAFFSARQRHRHRTTRYRPDFCNLSAPPCEPRVPGHGHRSSDHEEDCGAAWRRDQSGVRARKGIHVHIHYPNGRGELWWRPQSTCKFSPLKSCW